MNEYAPKCGKTETHDGHTFIDQHFKERWCGGLCGCGMRGPHGPGEHK